MSAATVAKKNWADLSELPDKPSHRRSTQARHARFLKRYNDEKVTWHGTYIGYAKTSHDPPFNTSAPVDDKKHETSAAVDDMTNGDPTLVLTSAPVDEKPTVEATSAGFARDTSAGVDDFCIAAQVSSRLTREKELLASELAAYKEQLQRAEFALGAWISCAESLFSQLQATQSIEHSNTDINSVWDEARISAIERSVSEQALLLVKLEQPDIFPIIASEVADSLETFQAETKANTFELVHSLQEAVERRCNKLQLQINNVSTGCDSSVANSEGGNHKGGMRNAVCHQIQTRSSSAEHDGIGSLPSGSKGGNAACHQLQCDQQFTLEDLPCSATEISLDPRPDGSWAKAPGRVSLDDLPISASEVILSIDNCSTVSSPRSDGSWAKAPGRVSQDDLPTLAFESIQDCKGTAAHDQLTNNVVEDGPVQREQSGNRKGGNAVCHQLQTNNVVEDGPVQREYDGSHKGGNAVCHQLQTNNVVEDGPVQREQSGNHKGGNAVCHQLQHSHTIEFTALSISEFLAIAADIKRSRPHLQQQVPILAICDIDRSIVQMPQLSIDPAGQLSQEELDVMRMTESEFETKMQADQDVLKSLYGRALFENEGDDKYEESCQTAHAPLPEECCHDARAPLSVGTRVCLHGLETSHLNGMGGMVSSNVHNQRYKVLLNDGTTRKFKANNLRVTSLSHPTRVSQTHSSVNQVSNSGPSKVQSRVRFETDSHS